MKVYRQGDVALIPVMDANLVRVLYEDRTVKPRASRILRRGENGGVHMLEAPAKGSVAKEAVPESTLVEYNGRLYVLSPSGVRVVHREHKPITLPKGTYEVRPQREAQGRGQRQVFD